MKKVMSIVMSVVMMYSAFSWGEDMFSALQLLTNYYSASFIGSKSGILEKYCKGMLSSNPASGQLYIEGVGESAEGVGERAFSSQTSLFVYALCSAWNPEWVTTSSLQEGVFKEKFVEKLALQQREWINEERKDVCKEGGAMRCDLSRYSFKIYTTLMSDIFKIKWAHVAGITSITEGDTSSKIAEVFETYFQRRESDMSALQKSFPKTSSMISRNQRHFQKSLSSVVMLDNDVLAAWAMENCTADLVSERKCGLHMSGHYGMNEHFVHLIYNEYLNYRIFIDYYTHQLSKIIQNANDTDKVAYQNELAILVTHRGLLERSLKTAIEEFQDFATTYILHIGLVWYQEVLLEFRDKYAVKMVPPFYTLYEKFRNVQPAN